MEESKRHPSYPLSSYTTKVCGIIITAIMLMLMLIVELHGTFFLFKYSADRQFDLFFSSALFGMYAIAFSREKKDDERVRAVRAKAVQMSFMLLLSTLISFSGAMLFSKSPQTCLDMTTIRCLTAFGLGLYLIIFHFRLYRDPA